MARFAGIIGFVKTVETEGSAWEEQKTERHYKGDVVRDARRWEKPTEVNDSLTISNEINIVADSYLLHNYAFIKYVKWDGNKWKVNYIELNHPRIRLTLGGLYNENEG
jgi:hypothetical protein